MFFFNPLNTSFSITPFHPQGPLLHHLPSSIPPWPVISRASSHSRGTTLFITVHDFHFQLFLLLPPSKTLHFFTQHSKSITKQKPTLIFQNQNLKLRIQSHGFFKRNPFPRLWELKNSSFSSFKAPISKLSHHEKPLSYLNPHFPPSKTKNFCHLKESQISYLAQVNSALCEIRTTLLHLCEIRTTLSTGAKFAPPYPLVRIFEIFTPTLPIPSL